MEKEVKVTVCVEKRKEILAALSNGVTVSEASIRYHVSTSSIYNWRLEPEKSLVCSPRQPHVYSSEEKMEVLRQVEEGARSIREIAEANRISSVTLRNWIRDKNQILAVYLAEKQLSLALEGNNSVEAQQTMASKKDIRTLSAENNSLKDENLYLKAKIAYLEKLMELNGTPAPEFKKKQDTRPSGLSAKAENGE